MDLAQYRELAAFAKFGSELDKATQAQLTRGERLVEILKQEQYSPWPVEDQVAILWAASKGYFDDIPLAQVKRCEGEFMRYFRSSGTETLKAIAEKKKLDDELEAQLKKLTEEFKATFSIES